MPLSDRNDRASAIGVGLPFFRGWPNPDALLNRRADREQMAYLYTLDPLSGGGLVCGDAALTACVGGWVDLEEC